MHCIETTLTRMRHEQAMNKHHIAARTETRELQVYTPIISASSRMIVLLPDAGNVKQFVCQAFTVT